MSVSWPPAVVERARAIAAGTLEPAPTHDAATVVLVRDAAVADAHGNRLEVYLQRRVSTMAFAAGMFVFPGGKVEPADDAGPGLPAAWAEAFAYGDQQLLRRLVGAAIRETAEEAGVVVAANSLRPFAHWVTPEVEPRRYDTRFLLAALPPGQLARLADGESDRSLWLRPREALTHRMLPPTQAALRVLATYPDTEAAFAAEPVIIRVLPRVVIDGAELRLELGP